MRQQSSFSLFSTVPCFQPDLALAFDMCALLSMACNTLIPQENWTVLPQGVGLRNSLADHVAAAENQNGPLLRQLVFECLGLVVKRREGLLGLLVAAELALAVLDRLLYRVVEGVLTLLLAIIISPWAVDRQVAAGSFFGILGGFGHVSQCIKVTSCKEWRG